MAKQRSPFLFIFVRIVFPAFSIFGKIVQFVLFNTSHNIIIGPRGTLYSICLFFSEVRSHHYLKRERGEKNQPRPPSRWYSMTHPSTWDRSMRMRVQLGLKLALLKLIHRRKGQRAWVRLSLEKGSNVWNFPNTHRCTNFTLGCREFVGIFWPISPQSSNAGSVQV